MADNPQGTSTQLSFAEAQGLLMTPPPEAETVSEQAPEELIEDDAPEPTEEETTEDEVEAEAEAEFEEDDAEEGDVEDEEDAEGEDQQQPEMVSVTVDGETFEVTLEEAAKGYQRQSAFTKGMQKNAEDRKALEAEKNETRQYRDAYQQGLQQIQQYLEQTSAEPNWDELREELPADEYAKQWTDYQRFQERKKQISAENERIGREQQAEQVELWKTHLGQQSELMLDKIPQWRDEGVRQTERAELIDFAVKEYGYTQEEINQASDHRAIKALYDSWQLSKISDQAKTAKKKVRAAPKTPKAGTPRTKKEVQASARRKRRAAFDQAPSFKNAVDYLIQSGN